MIDNYLEQFQFSNLPLPAWGVVVLWAIFFVATIAMYRRSSSLSKRQSAVVFEESSSDAREMEPELIVRQGLLSLLLFASAFVIGPSAFVFLGGGWAVAAAISVGLNLYSVLFSRALVLPGAVTGSVKFSRPLLLRAKAAQLFGGGAMCICICALIPHLSLIGACLFLWATAYGYQRQAWKAAQPDR